MTHQNRHRLVEEGLTRAAHHLPAQGPIGVFIHHNTLHAFQHLPFEEAVVEASRIFGTEPFMTEAAYRSAFASGRIDSDDLDAAIAEEPPGEPVGAGLPPARTLKRLLIEHPVSPLDGPTLQWHLEETDALTQFDASLPERLRRELHASWQDVRSLGAEEASRLAPEDVERRAVRALWAHCHRRASSLGSIARPHQEPPRRRPHEAVDALLIRLCAAFLDQGIAYWSMPRRSLGFLRAVRDLMSQPGQPDPAGLPGLCRAFRTQHDASAMEVVEGALEKLGVREADWARRIEEELLALSGWAGLMHTLEEKPHLAPHFRPPCSLLDLLAVRLTAVAQADAAAVPSVVPTSTRRSGIELCFRLFELVQRLGMSPKHLESLGETELRALLMQAEAFDDVARRRIWHLAYERHHRVGVLSALARHSSTRSTTPSAAPRHQAVFCFDEREESLRRHFEELDPAFETFGAAGFFGIAFEYRGKDDVHGAPLCPILVTPQHRVVEEPLSESQRRATRRRQYLRLLAGVGRGLAVGSRGLLRGWLATALGLIAFLPLAVRVLSPRIAANLRSWLARSILPAPRTTLALTRAADDEASSGIWPGFTVEEQVERVATVLRHIGLVRGFAPLVTVVGHGSSSLNNPHESAHDCGACGGRRGAPNARAFAAMVNTAEVREGLRVRGIDIPHTTWFIGGYHNTCSDAVIYADLEAVPDGHRHLVVELRSAIDEARARSAHERCRRFEAAAGARTPARALRHVEGRAEHLGEPRPEYGHCTIAICVIGRRHLTRGLFLDRRAFVISYDPTQDDDTGTTLGEVLAAAAPVGAGINLEYYFSFVDNEGYGCGTKLPHNITGYVGVMNGHASDLRTGLPWQMVEIHEPVRLLTIIETTPHIIGAIAARDPTVRQLVENRWIQLVTLDPESGTLEVYDRGAFVPFAPAPGELPEAPTSLDWYGGHSHHLPIARITAGLSRVA